MNPKYKNILLINPWEGEVFPPPSIGYLQAAIKAVFGTDVNVIARDLTPSLNLLKSNNFDLIAVSFHSFSIKHAKLIKGLAKNTHLICGGHHPTSLPQQMLNIGYNQVVLGEGENLIIDIILGNSDELVYNNKNHFKSIDEIPFPDYSGLSGDWKNSQSELGYPIISSRGCPFICSFCASSIFWNRKIYIRSVDSVVSEITNNIKSFGMNNWMFEDDNFTLNKERAKEICKKIKTEINEKFGAKKWQCASRAESLNDIELCKALVDSGCKTVWLGVESFSQDSLDRCKKNTTVEKMVSGIETAESVGLQTMSQFIIGLPGDTEDDIKKTAEKIKSIKMSRVGANIVWILPGTDIYIKAKEHGFSDNIYLENGAPFYTYEKDINTLNRWTQTINTAKY